MATAVISSFSSNPLTTTFSRPDDCSGIHRSGFISGVDIETSCMPDGFDPKPTAYFSPGLQCPDGYVSACHDHTGVESITTVTCCPKVEDVTLSCVTASTLKDEFSDLFCTWIAPEDETSMPLTLSDNDVTSTNMVTFESPGGLNAYGVRMVYQSSDLEAATATTNSPNNNAGSIQDQDDGGDSGGGLSTGAKVAIGVVVPVVAIALAAAGFFFGLRHRKKKALEGTAAAAAASGTETKPLPVYGGPPIAPPQELPVGSPRPAELPGESPVQEKYAGRY